MRSRWSSPRPRSAGIGAAFGPIGAGNPAGVALLIDGIQVGEGQIANLLRILSSTGMDLGRSLSPINADYQSPFKHPGRILSAVFELPTGPQDHEIDAQVRAAMTRQ